MLRLTRCALLFGALAAFTAAAADQTPKYGFELQGFHYPYPLQQFSFTSQGQQLKMGYMDVPPEAEANGRTAVLMHGKNFCAATWQDSIKALSKAGYRVIAPDQIGFCSSTKPQHYQYSFQQLAQNTQALLQNLKISQAVIIGHSTGGMLATRYALMYPQATERLVLVNPIGLEDWKAKGVPWRSVDRWFERELNTSAEGIRNYELKTYYVGRWKPEYDRWVDMLAGLNNGPGHRLVAWNSALIYDMIFTQPVYYEFKNLQTPTTLMIGTADTTAIGSDIAPPAVKETLGHYEVLGKQAAKLIPHATLIEFPGLGHAPQMEQPDRFNQALIKALQP
ncbi:Haloalkane dehalogenase [Serratia entomophila]|uniref:alpha/beta fold hydrolase n=1 Tax=Serratia entomophila TaxID=42906 RepID=UPI00217AB90B|nr:alpha/beta hydrolase [Serratia entomophila]CAI0807893.1 Haloalkane dehalogenase [Serratia entomophila]CAI1586201.1 Haloalkane dehalogenase [Serratia entomophila]